ncbi:cytochrome b [Yersinia nurmii]|uniref:Cytochrome b n=1 Tax=Yersinia nurmii TaxID=685706 RepID=A0AAW7K8C2_9GAMM|nr:cytochrome b [Yersinia nurmii]MDN0087421.1 cytochrome b [Yersinia nurmii]CNE60359.1 cytochrome b561 family protein [Yersinia nurmii]
MKNRINWLDTPSRFGLISRTLHWLMALLFLWQFFSVIVWHTFGRTAFTLWMDKQGSHTTVGFLLFILVIVRALWRGFNIRRSPRSTPNKVNKIAIIGHMTLYLLMFIIPLLALLRAYAGGKGMVVMGIPVLPTTGIEINRITAWVDNMHGPLAWLLLFCIGGHILMAIIHRFILRDANLRPMI